MRGDGWANTFKSKGKKSLFVAKYMSVMNAWTNNQRFGYKKCAAT